MLARFSVLLVASALVASASAFQAVHTPMRMAASTARRTTTPVALFNMFKESDESKRRKEEQYEATKQMQDTRRDPVAYQLAKNKRRNTEIAERAAADGNLPSGWSSKISEKYGQRYFFKDETPDESSWDPPIAEMVALLEQQQREEFEALMAKED